MFAETPIQPFGYLSVSSGESNLTLSDTAGAVRLLDTFGEIHGLTVSYDEVEEGSTYALDGPVEWYGRLPQLSPHLIYLPKRQLLLKRLLKKATAVKTNTQTAKKATSAKTTVAKTSATSSAKKAATKVTNAKPENFTEAPLEQKSRPLLLATFAVIAVLYGLYEYRHDPSNSVWRAKGYIRAWRKNR